MDLSVVVPIYNERENVHLLYDALCASLDRAGSSYELVLVDDGSTDGTVEQLRLLASRDQRVRLVLFRRNYGQTAAIQAGLQFAEGDVIVTLDGDLQNDPDDIPMMVAKLDEGYDLVHGWRKDRQDPFLSRRLPSQVANWLISRTCGFPIHDLGCTLKAIRREIAQELELYGEMHRFIPILASQRGARCVEVVTRHHARRFGDSKYGISRTLRVVLDLITVKYLLDYFASPMKLFGFLGIGSLLVSAIAGVSTLGMKIFGAVDMTGNPLILLTVLGVVAGLQFLSLGLLGEVLARIYFGTQPQRNYAVRELVNFDEPAASTSLQARRAA